MSDYSGPGKAAGDLIKVLVPLAVIGIIALIGLAGWFLVWANNHIFIKVQP